MKISHFLSSFFRNHFPFDSVSCFCAAAARAVVTAVSDILYRGKKSKKVDDCFGCARLRFTKPPRFAKRPTDPLHKYHFDDINEMRMEIYI